MSEEVGPLTVMTVPEEVVPALLEFVARLQSGDAEVGGHMVSRTIGANLEAGFAVALHLTWTGCQSTAVHDGDYACADHDAR
jgi:hypothetical protein